MFECALAAGSSTGTGGLVWEAKDERSSVSCLVYGLDAVEAGSRESLAPDGSGGERIDSMRS